MKSSLYPSVVLVGLLLLVSCEGPVGPAGEPGMDGGDGVPGMTVQLVPPPSFIAFREDPSLLILEREIAVPSLTLAGLGAGAIFVQIKDGPMLPFVQDLPVGSVQHNYTTRPGFLRYWIIGSSDFESTSQMPRLTDTLRIVTVEPIIE